MTSRLEQRIHAQRYHGVTSSQWWKLAEEEQSRLIAEAESAEIGLSFLHCAGCFAVLPFEPNYDYDERRVWQCESCGLIQEARQ